MNTRGNSNRTKQDELHDSKTATLIVRGVTLGWHNSAERMNKWSRKSHISDRELIPPPMWLFLHSVALGSRIKSLKEDLVLNFFFISSSIRVGVVEVAGAWSHHFRFKYLEYPVHSGPILWVRRDTLYRN